MAGFFALGWIGESIFKKWKKGKMNISDIEKTIKQGKTSLTNIDFDSIISDQMISKDSESEEKILTEFILLVSKGMLEMEERIIDNEGLIDLWVEKSKIYQEDFENFSNYIDENNVQIEIGEGCPKLHEIYRYAFATKFLPKDTEEWIKIHLTTCTKCCETFRHFVNAKEKILKLSKNTDETKIFAGIYILISNSKPHGLKFAFLMGKLNNFFNQVLND